MAGRSDPSINTCLHHRRSDTSGVKNLGEWLTRVVARVCLALLRSHELRREESLDVHAPEPIMSREGGSSRRTAEARAFKPLIGACKD